MQRDKKPCYERKRLRLVDHHRCFSNIRNERVLEVGTNSGCQTAVPAREVFTVEILQHLAERARERLGPLGYGNIHIRVGDDSLGWPEEGPFDVILCTADAVDPIATGGEGCPFAAPQGGIQPGRSLPRRQACRRARSPPRGGCGSFRATSRLG